MIFKRTEIGKAFSSVLSGCWWKLRLAIIIRDRKARQKVVLVMGLM